MPQNTENPTAYPMVLPVSSINYEDAHDNKKVFFFSPLVLIGLLQSVTFKIFLSLSNSKGNDALFSSASFQMWLVSGLTRFIYWIICYFLCTYFLCLVFGKFPIQL